MMWVEAQLTLRPGLAAEIWANHLASLCLFVLFFLTICKLNEVEKLSSFSNWRVHQNYLEGLFPGL